MIAARASVSARFTAGSCSLARAVFQSRQRAYPARLEYGLGGVVSGAGILGEQGEAADRGIEGASQSVVEADYVNVGRRGAGERLTGGGIGELAGIVFDVDGLAFGAEHQTCRPAARE